MVERKWYLIDADGQTLGRLATVIACLLRGKKVAVTGKKAEQKVYYRHTGYPGGLKETSYEAMLERKPTEILRRAVRGMMPKTRLGRQQLKKLKIYAGPEHPHEAQAPQPYKVR
jgi:large subunit ribosomal protein L13